MLEFVIAAALLGVAAEPEQPAPEMPAPETQKAEPGHITAWTMPKLDYSGNDCEQFIKRSLDGFGKLKVGTPCTAKPEVAASKGHSMDKRN